MTSTVPASTSTGSAGDTAPHVPRADWRNWSGLERVAGVEAATATDTDDVVRLVTAAREQHRTVKAVGTGHSFTGIATPRDVQLRPDRMRGILAVDRSDAGAMTVTVRAGTVALGAGTLSVYWDDARGVRTQLDSRQIRGGAAGAVIADLPAPPADARRVSALFEGADDTGEQLLAAGLSQ